MLIDPGAAAVVDELTTDDFWRSTHQVIFLACQALIERRVALDFISLKNYCEVNKTIDAAGGPGYIASLGDGVPRATNWPYYAGILRDLRMRRALLRVSDRILAEVYAGDLDGLALAQEADNWILDMDRGSGATELIGQRDAVKLLFADIERRTAARGGLIGMPTGLTTLNEMTNGWQPGDLVILAARPSIGKTALACHMALTGSSRPCPVLCSSGFCLAHWDRSMANVLATHWARFRSYRLRSRTILASPSRTFDRVAVSTRRRTGWV
jgi:replicative DNA helicase